MPAGSAYERVDYRAERRGVEARFDGDPEIAIEDDFDRADCNVTDVDLDELTRIVTGCRVVLLLGLAELACPVLKGRDRDAALFGELGEGESLGFTAGEEVEVLVGIASGVFRRPLIVGAIRISINVRRMRRLRTRLR
jgi:hypothetical protein